MRKVVVGILIGLMLGTAGTLFCVQFYATMLAGMTSEHWPEYLYFLIQSLGVFAMIATVIVALFGNEIKSWIFSGRCEVSIEGGGFREDLGETEDTQSPQTQLYECTLLIRNTDHETAETSLKAGTYLTIRKLSQLVVKAVGFEGEVAFDASKPDGTIRKLIDVSKLHSLGWHHHVEIEDGVRRLFDWYKSSLES